MASDQAPRRCGSIFFAWRVSLKGGFYLPDRRNINAKFVSQVLSGYKQLLKLSAVKWVGEVPSLKELSVKALFYKTQRKEELNKYLPDTSALSRLDRQYFLNVGSTRS